MYRSSKQEKLSDIFVSLRLSVKKTSLFNVISQFEVRAVVLCYREELSSRCAITSPSFLPYFIYPFLSNQMEDVSTKGLSVPCRVEREGFGICCVFLFPLHYTRTGTHQMEPASPIQALGVNPFPSRFINRTIPWGGFAR